MTILIVEDEKYIAKHLADMVGRIHPSARLNRCATIDEAWLYLKNHRVDLLLLDLNLKGRDGFQVLRQLVAQDFQVIVVSAHIEKALEAFEYGVLDFVPKPFSEIRLRKAFDRLKEHQRLAGERQAFFGVKKRQGLEMIKEEDIVFFEAYGHYAKIHLLDGSFEVYDKSLSHLESILDTRYERVHKSFIVKMPLVQSWEIAPGGKYSLLLPNGHAVPVSRRHYKDLRERWVK